jgi:hypothetical protein
LKPLTKSLGYPHSSKPHLKAYIQPLHTREETLASKHRSLRTSSWSVICKRRMLLTTTSPGGPPSKSPTQTQSKPASHTPKAGG